MKYLFFFFFHSVGRYRL